MDQWRSRSSLHIKPEVQIAYGEVGTAACLARTVAPVNALRPRPDLMLATGDLIDAGSTAAALDQWRRESGDDPQQIHWRL